MFQWMERFFGVWLTFCERWRSRFEIMLPEQFISLRSNHFHDPIFSDDFPTHGPSAEKSLYTSRPHHNAHTRLSCLSRMRALIRQISILCGWEETDRSKNCGVYCSTLCIPHWFHHIRQLLHCHHSLPSSSPPLCIRLWSSTRQLLILFTAQGQVPSPW
jgi:hypothetical protein